MQIAFAPVAALLLASVTGDASASEPARHLIYLHGRIVQEQQSERPRHPEHGYYELEKIVAALRASGFVVSAEIRPKDQKVGEAADAVVAQVQGLLDSGVPAERITVLGASMGATIAMRVSARLGNPAVRFALLSPCLSASITAIAREEGKPMRGRILAIREESDVPTAECPPLDPKSKATPPTAREVVIHTGTRHGFLYRPLSEWLDPVVGWARADQQPKPARNPLHD